MFVYDNGRFRVGNGTRQEPFDQDGRVPGSSVSGGTHGLERVNGEWEITFVQYMVLT